MQFSIENLCTWSIKKNHYLDCKLHIINFHVNRSDYFETT